MYAIRSYYATVWLSLDKNDNDLSRFLIYFIAALQRAILFSLYNWRCPACSKYLGKQRSPKYCSKCGVALQ